MCDSSKKCVLSSFCDKKKSKDETILSLLQGTKVLKNSADGLVPIADIEAHLKNKVVALYFSAHWCPPCRQFTPILKVSQATHKSPWQNGHDIFSEILRRCGRFRIRDHLLQQRSQEGRIQRLFGRARRLVYRPIRG